MAEPYQEKKDSGFGCMLSILFFIVAIITLFTRHSTVGWIILGSVLFLNLISFIRYLRKTEKEKKQLVRQIAELQLPGRALHSDREIISSNHMTKIAVDEGQRKIYIWGPADLHISQARPGMAFTLFEYRYEDILAAEISQNGCPLATKTRRARSVLGQLDGLISKETGHIVGESCEDELDYISELQLNLIADDMSRPLHNIQFYTYTAEGAQTKIKDGSREHQDELARLRDWYMFFCFVIAEADQAAGEGESAAWQDHDSIVQEEASFFEDHLTQREEVTLTGETDSLSDMEKLLEQIKRKQLGE